MAPKLEGLSAAAACIYMASLLQNNIRSPKAIAEIAGVSDSTIRNAYKDLYNDKDILITPKSIERGADVSKLVKPTT